MSDEEILHYNIPTATPFVYEFDRHLNPLRHYYVLGDDLDETAIAQMEAEVASQGTTSYGEQPLNVEELEQQAQLDLELQQRRKAGP